MTLTLLLDLDDTLLSNDIDQFQKVYLQRLAEFLRQFVAPDAMLHQMSKAVHAMLSKDTALGTLQDTFDANFYTPLGLEKEALSDRIAEFYATQFPGLRSLTQPRPAAIRLVEQAFQRGYRVVIATNPLFPRTAILQRLDWAGLRPDAYPFALISSYETFHFCKPNPAYYCEILAQLGWPEDRFVMIGNNLSDDILPTARLQFSTFYLNKDQSTVPAPTSGAISGSGSLEQIPAWLEIVEEQAEKPAFDSRRTVPPLLKAIPAALDSLCAGLSAQAWQHRPAANEWSLTEIIYHLRDLDVEVNLPRLQKVLAEQNPFLAGIVSDVWASERNYQAQNGLLALRQFSEQRTTLSAWLQTLQPEDWKRPARHAIFGPTTMLELSLFILQHDRNHLQQALALLQTQPI